MSQEALEAKIVKKAVSILRMARHVIEKLHDDKEKGFQEEPSLSDLVMVAQIIGQTSMIDRLGESGLPEGAEGSQVMGQAIVGSIMMPDILVMWTPEGWCVNGHPDFQVNPQWCKSKDELAAILQALTDICAQNRIS